MTTRRTSGRTATGLLGALMVGSIAGAAAGSLVTVALRPAGGMAADGPTEVILDERELARAIAEANEPLRDEIGRLRAALANAGGHGGFASSGSTGGDAGVSPPERPGRVTAPSDAAVWRGASASSGDDVRRGVELTPEPQLPRLKQVRDLEENQATRRRYYFMSEADALAWFGTPTSVTTNDGDQYWNYSIVVGTYPDGEEMIQEFGLRFQRGRLIGAWGDVDADE